MRYLLSLLFLLVASIAGATSYYVDKRTGSGSTCSSGSPCATLNAGVAKLTTAGDQLLVRGDASTIYDEEVNIGTDVAVGVNGTVTNCNATTTTSCITIKPDTGNSPRLTNCTNGDHRVFQILNLDYWNIQGFQFINNCGDGQTGERAVSIESTTAAAGPAKGNIVQGNTFTNWCAPDETTGIVTGKQVGCYTVNVSSTLVAGNDATKRPTDNIIQDNIFIGSQNQPVNIRQSIRTIVQRNEFDGIRCGYNSDTATKNALNHTAVRVDGNKASTTDAALQDDGTIVRFNYAHDWETCVAASPTICGAGSGEQAQCDYSAVVYWNDVGAINGVFEGNVSDNAGTPGDNAEGIGLKIEAGCDNGTAYRNLLFDMGFVGLGVGNGNIGVDDTTWRNNTVIGSGQGGLKCYQGARAEIINNLISTRAGAGSAIELLGTAGDCFSNGGHTIDYNSYFDGSVGSSSLAKTTAVHTFTAWKALTTCGAGGSSACNFDAHGTDRNLATAFTGGSLTSDNPTDYRLASGDADLTSGNTGRARGAFVPVILATGAGAAVVQSATPNRVDLTFDSFESSPYDQLIFDGDGLCKAANWSCTKASVAWTVSSCAISGVDQVRLTMSTSASAGQSISCTYSPGAAGGNQLSDSYKLGNLYTSPAMGFTTTVTNNAGGASVPVYTQTNCAFYDATGTESGAALLESGATSITREAGSCFAVRCLADVTVANAAATAYGWKASTDGGAYAGVSGTCSGGNICFKAASFPSLTNDAVTTERLAGASTFVAGRIKLASGTSTSVTLNSGQGAEFLAGYCIDAAATVGRTYDFRLNAGGTDFDAYTVTPRVTVGATGSVTPTSGVFGSARVSGGLRIK